MAEQCLEPLLLDYLDLWIDHPQSSLLSGNSSFALMQEEQMVREVGNPCKDVQPYGNTNT